jgi:NAD(P)H-dependent FMN reductase
MKVLAIPGSLRAGSSNAALLRAAAALAPVGMQLLLYDGLGDLPHFNPDLDGEGQAPPAAVARLRSLVSASRGLVISSPEYAHGVPGSLKNALDWLVSHPDFAGKPVVLINASPTGGAHAQASLVETLRTMSARVLSDASVMTPVGRAKVDPQGNLSDPALASAVRQCLEALEAAIRDG